MTPTKSAAATTCVVLAFNGRNQLAVPAGPGAAGFALTGADPAAAAAALTAAFPRHTPPAEYYEATTPHGVVRVFQIGRAHV